MTDKEKQEAKEAILFQAGMYLDVFRYFAEKTRINEMAYRLTSDFFKAQYEGIQRGNRPDPMQFIFYPKKGGKQ